MNKQMINNQINKIGKVSAVTLGSRGFNYEMSKPVTFSGK